MIIKFKSKDTWVVFGEVDHVEYRNMTAKGEDPKKMGIESDIILYDPPDDGVTTEWFGIGFYTKNMDDSTQIIACAPIYLMNDQGRTVETI